MSKKFCIIGTSAAGISAAAKLRQLDDSADIVCFSDEQEQPYNKCFLADYVAGEKTEEQIGLRSKTFFQDKNIQIKLNTKIVKIDRDNKTIIDQNNNSYQYDKLLLAMGGSVFLPPILGIDKSHVFSFYTLDDSQKITSYSQQDAIKNVVIIGAGLSGLECADSVCDYVEKVTVVEMADQLLPRQVTKEGAQFIQSKMNDCGIDLLTEQMVQEITEDSVILKSGKMIKADMVVCAIGARPNGYLAEAADINVDHGAIITDDYLSTNDPNVYAAGDCALVTERLTGNKVKNCTWPEAMQQGMTAAVNMISKGTKKYPGVLIVTSSAFFGVKFFAAGQLHELESYNSQLRQSEEGYRFIVHQQGIVKGFLLIGLTHGISDIKRSLLTGQPLDGLIVSDPSVSASDTTPHITL